MYKKVTKNHYSRTAYYNFDLKRFLSLYKLTLQMTIGFIIKRIYFYENLNTKAGGMAVPRPYDFEMDFLRNFISGSAS